MDSVLSEQLMAEETGFKALVQLCPTMTLCVLQPFVLGLLHLLHFLPNHAFILTARAVTIDKNECSILRRRAATLKSNRALSPNRKSSGPIHLSPKIPSALDTEEKKYLSLVVSPELGDIYCSDYSFTIKTRCSYPTTERK